MRWSLGQGLSVEITLGVPAAEQRLIQERDGLRVQLADARDRLALCGAEVQRVRAEAEALRALLAAPECKRWHKALERELRAMEGA